MSGQVDPYVRVYYSISNDEKFRNIYGNNDYLATWLRLLMVADALYPSSAPIPRMTSQESLDALVEAELVEIVGFDQFQVVGLKAERDRRSIAGKKGADSRWHGNDNALGPDDPGIASPEEGPLLDEPRRDKTRPRQDETPRINFDGPGDGLQTLLASWGVMGVPLSPKLAVRLDGLVEDYGEEVVRGHLDRLHQDKTNREAGQYVFGLSNALRDIPKAPKPVDPSLQAERAREDAAAEKRRKRREELDGNEERP
jgi:hypothetical protein